MTQREIMKLKIMLLKNGADITILVNRNRNRNGTADALAGSLETKLFKLGLECLSQHPNLDTVKVVGGSNGVIEFYDAAQK